MGRNNRHILEEFKAPIKLKISALWTSAMFLYIYADYFNLYMAGKIEAMSKGIMGPLGEATQTIMLGVSATMAILSVMIFFSLLLPPTLNRWVNAILALAYSLIVLITLPGAQPFWIFFGVIEITLTLLIFWYAITWPKTAIAG